jgi:hypothetical protein
MNRKLTKLVRRGLFTPLPAPLKNNKPATTRPATPKLGREQKSVVFHSKGGLSVTELKQQRDITHEDLQPFDGTAKRDAADGWGEFDANPALYVAAICIVPTSSGPKKSYRMRVKPSVLAAKKKRVANMLRDIARDDAAYLKRKIRLTLKAMGKA